MDLKDYQEILDFMQFKGFDYPDYKPFIKFLDEEKADFDFTDELIQELIKSNLSEFDGYQEDKQDYKNTLIKFIEGL